MIDGRGDDTPSPTLSRVHCGENLFGIRIVTSGAGRGRNSEARRQILQAVITISRSRDRNLADMPGKAARSTQELPADDGTSTDSARYGQEEKVAAAAGTKAILAPSCGLCIVQG